MCCALSFPLFWPQHSPDLCSIIHYCGLKVSRGEGTAFCFPQSMSLPTCSDLRAKILFQPYCSFSVRITQTVDVDTSKQCQDWENWRENRGSRTTLHLSPLTHWAWRRFWINDAQPAHEISSNSDFFAASDRSGALCAWSVPWWCSDFLQRFQNKADETKKFKKSKKPSTSIDQNCRWKIFNSIVLLLLNLLSVETLLLTYLWLLNHVYF